MKEAVIPDKNDFLQKIGFDPESDFLFDPEITKSDSA